MTETANNAPETLPEIVRTKRRGTWKRVISIPWGIGYAPHDEHGPDAPPKFVLANDYPRVPRDIHQAWVSLAFHTCDGSVKSVDSGSEVAIIFARSMPDFKTWRAFVPRQEVGGTSVEADLNDLMDLMTGERFTGIPDGWAYAGSSHSHNTMGAFFSSTDDKDELDLPGLHYVVGKIDVKGKTYGHIASIVMRGVRHVVDTKLLIDLSVEGMGDEEGNYHPDVLGQITKVKPISSSSYSSYFAGMVSHSNDDKDDALAEYLRLRVEDEEATLAEGDDSKAIVTDPKLAREQVIRYYKAKARELEDKEDAKAVHRIIEAIRRIPFEDLGWEARDLLWQVMCDLLEDGSWDTV